MAYPQNRREHQEGSWDEMPRRDYADGMVRWHEMPNLEQGHAAGNGFALMLAVYKCAQGGQPMPAWVARALSSAFRRVYDAEARSWDDVFGLPRPKSSHIAKVQPRRELSRRIYERVQNRADTEPGIGDELFEQIGLEMGHCKTHVSELYYEAKGIIEREIVRNPDALADPTALALVDDDLILNMMNEPDPLLDCDDPVLR